MCSNELFLKPLKKPDEDKRGTIKDAGGANLVDFDDCGIRLNPAESESV
jgi:hypothetical protein